MAERKAQDQNSENSSSFTNDAENTTMMPSVTRLLDRKKLELSKSFEEGKSAPKNAEKNENLSTTPGATPPTAPSSPPSAPSAIPVSPPAPPGAPPAAPTSPPTPSPPVAAPPLELTPALTEMEAPPSPSGGEILLSLDAPRAVPELEPGPVSPPAPTIAAPAGGIELSSDPSDGGIELSFERNDNPAPAASPSASPSVLDGPGALARPLTQPLATAASASNPAPAGLTPPSQIQRASRRAELRPIPSFQMWDKAMLANNADPVAQGLTQLLAAGATGAVFLAPAPQINAQLNAQSIEFLAVAGIADEMKKLVWSGLMWKPSLVMELWQDLLREGFIELSPPQLDTVATSHRNVVRGAFGSEAGEWLLLLRVGTPQACRGILVVVSRNSLDKNVVAVMRILGS